MKIFSQIVLCVLLLSSLIYSTDYKVYYLGGQSNMVGFGYNKDLPAAMNSAFEGVMIFHGEASDDNVNGGGTGLWSVLQPGHGAGFETDGNTNEYSERFGLELTFGKRLSELDPGSNIAIIKYAKGGSSLDKGEPAYGTWDPDYEDNTGVNQYDFFLATIRNAFAVTDIDGDGTPDRLIPAGIIWMQGESDAAGNRLVALRYESNLHRLMNLIRAALRVDDLPVAICSISDSGQDDDGKVWEYLELVQNAQRQFVKHDSNAVLVTGTDKYGYSDKWHYDSEGYIDLGKKCAEAIFELNKK